MLEEYLSYTVGNLEHCASIVGTSEPVKLLSKTGLEKFRRVVEIFREQGLMMSQKAPTAMQSAVAFAIPGFTTTS